jgi:NADH-ubiquinone oxidoreductase chain 1
MLDLSFLIVVFLLLMIFVMVGIAFLTLLERKVLGYVHIRKGPNRVGFVDILQPFLYAIKLFSREQYFPLVSNYLIYHFFSYFWVFSFFVGLVFGPLFERFYFI